MRGRNKKGNGTGIIVFVVLCIFGIVAFGKINLQDRKRVRSYDELLREAD